MHSGRSKILKSNTSMDDHVREKMSVKSSNDKVCYLACITIHMHIAALCTGCKMAVIYTCFERKVMMEADLVWNSKSMPCWFELTSCTF